MEKNESFNFEEFEKQAIEKLKQGKSLTGEDGIFTPLIKRILEAGLEGELKSHLDNKDVKNRRNGRLSKNLKTSFKIKLK